MKLSHPVLLLVTLLATVLALIWVQRLELSPDVADLLPEAGEGAGLRDFIRVFGQGDLAMVLVRGPDSDITEEAAEATVRALRGDERVRAVVDRIRFDLPRDPSLAWVMAGPKARDRLKAAIEPEGMGERLNDSKKLLLAPGSAGLGDSFRLDPLRLRQIPLEEEVRLAASAKTSASNPFVPDPSGMLVADGGRARLILISAKGQALRGEDARAFSEGIQETLRSVRERYTPVKVELAGAHAIASETESVLRRDLLWSGLLSTLLVALAFALTFRRLRALLAVLPPLALGTLWTAAAGALAFQRMSALTLGFLAVVVGVGLDTGVHVYAALVEGRRQGLSPSEAASHARRDTARPALVAALTAAIAFSTLSMSRVPALRQFGLLCAAGELLTAIAILIITPTIGAWLERGNPPPPDRPLWVELLDRLRRFHAAPILLAITVFIPTYALFTLGPPKLGTTLVGIRPTGLPSIETQETIDTLFGGGPGQWVVLLRDQNIERARTRADRLFEAIEAEGKGVESVDGLTRFAPSLETQKARIKERDALDLPGRVPMLRAALEQTGFDASAMSEALARFNNPGMELRDELEQATEPNQLFRARYLSETEDGSWAALYVRPREGHQSSIAKVIRDTDDQAIITGYARLESALRDSLREDLPRVMGAAVILVALAILLTLRRWRDGLVAWFALAFGVLWVVALVRWLPLPIHLYNAFVLPVLLGITVDEVMFLLHRKRDGGMLYALRVEGPIVLVTGVTTAAGFAALGICSFPGLRDMGILGVVGVLLGLLSALWVVPVLGGRYTEGSANRYGGTQ